MIFRPIIPSFSLATYLQRRAYVRVDMGQKKKKKKKELIEYVEIERLRAISP